MPNMQTVAGVLEKNTDAAIADWLGRVDSQPDIISVPLTHGDRCAHLPEMFRDIVLRLRNPLPLGTRTLTSDAADNHGNIRREQGYSASMLVEESRMLQVSIFETLQRHLEDMDSASLLGDIMTIADEVDSQLAQTMSSFLFEPKANG
jgi:phosphopantothenate synthetase